MTYIWELIFTRYGEVFLYHNEGRHALMAKLLIQ